MFRIESIHPVNPSILKILIQTITVGKALVTGLRTWASLSS